MVAMILLSVGIMSCGEDGSNTRRVPTVRQFAVLEDPDAYKYEYKMDFNRKEFRIDEAAVEERFRNLNSATRVVKNPLEPENGVPVVNSRLGIKRTDFKKLYDIAKKEAIIWSSMSPFKTVTGIYITYGLRPDNQIQLYFSPWVMYVTSKRNEKIIGSVKICNEANVYQYDTTTDNSGFKEIPIDNISYIQCVERFRNQVYIRQPRKEFRPMRFRDDWKSDAKGAFFPFQQLDHAFEKLQESSGDASTSDTLYFYQGAATLRGQVHGRQIVSIGGKRFKITSLMSPEKKESFKVLVQPYFINKDGEKVKNELYFDNFAGLCPPSCNEFQYTIVPED